MIHTNRIVTVGEQECIIDRPIVLYRGDREVEIEFTLVGNEFMFSEEGNVIKSVNASHGQLVLNTPSGEHMFSELAECHEGKVVFVVTKEMIDEFIEMGFYSFQIRLYDSAEMKSRVTIPPVMNGFDIRNPIAAEDETNVVDQGIVDYARIFKDQSNEELPTFTWDGEYVKTEWAHHDVITENKLNKIEDALYSINANIKESDVVMLNALDQVKKDADKYVKEHMAEVEADVDEFERNLNTDVQQFKIDTNAAMTAHKNEVSEELEGFSGEIESINSQLADIVYDIKLDKNTNNDKLIVNVIQEQIDFAYENNFKKVRFPKNEVIEIIDSYNGNRPNKNHNPTFLNLKSNTEYDLNGSTVKVKANDYGGYNVFALTLLEHTVLKNGIIEGDKDEHTYLNGTSEWGYGVNISACKFCTIKNIEMKNLTGDGVYLGGILSHYSVNTLQTEMELGELDAVGAPVSSNKAYRINKYISISELLNDDDYKKGLSKKNKLCLFPGNPHGYGPLNQYVRKEVIVCYYDENYNFISSKNGLLRSDIDIPINAFFYKFYHPNTDLSNTDGTQGIMHRIGESSEETYIEKCYIHDCRRQGVSISRSKNSGVKECIIENIKGTAPQSCIDIEDGGHSTEHLIIENNIFRNSVYGLICYDGSYHNIRYNRFENCNVAQSINACTGVIIDGNTYIGGRVSFAADSDAPGYTPRQNSIINCRVINASELNILGAVILDKCVMKNISAMNIKRGARVYNTIFLNEYEQERDFYIEDSQVYNTNFETLNTKTKILLTNSVFDRVSLNKGQIDCSGNIQIKNSKIDRFRYGNRVNAENNITFTDTVLGISDNPWYVTNTPQYPYNISFINCEINQYDESVYGIFTVVSESKILYRNSTINVNEGQYMHYSNNMAVKCDSISFYDCTINGEQNITIASNINNVNNIIFENTTGLSLPNRPTLSENNHIGYSFYDKTINKPIWWNGTNWIDVNGTSI